MGTRVDFWRAPSVPATSGSCFGCDSAEAAQKAARRAEALLAMQERVGTAGGDLQGIMDAVTGSALDVFPHATGAIIELCEDDELVYRSASGSAAERVGLRLKIGASLSGRCITEGRALHCRDSARDPRVDRAACLAVGACSMLVVPLHDRGNVAGVLKILSSQANAFEDRDLLTLQLLAGPVAIGFAAATEAEALRASRAADRRFLATFDQAAVGIAHVTPEGRFSRVNNRFCDIAGHERGSLTGRTFQEITHPEDLEIDLGYVRALLAGEVAHYSIEKRYLRKDGSPAWVNLTVSLVQDESGAPDFFVAVVEDINARKRAEEDAKHDPLTGLLNRRGLVERLERELGRSSFHEQPLMIAFLDLDGFKAVNDVHGHAAGDTCLQAVAMGLAQACRPSDVIARLGGDEFIILMPDLQLPDAQAVLDRVLAAVRKAGSTGGWSIGASIGALCVTASEGTRIEDIIVASDQLMYRAKEAGGGQFSIEAIG